MVKSLDFQDFRNLKDKANDARITLPKFFFSLSIINTRMYIEYPSYLHY